MKNTTKFILTLVLLIFTFSGSAQTMTTFRQSYDLGAFDITGGMVQTPAREFVIAGLNNSFGPYYGDAVKIDTAGNIVWAKAYNAGFATNFSDIKNVSTGGYIITGSSTSGGGGAILLRIDALGNVIWSFRYQLPNFSAGKTSNEFGNAVIETTDGGFLVGGGVDYFWDGVSGATVDTTSAMGFKVNSSGVLQWSRVWTIATTNPDEHFINDVAESADGYFFVGESSEGAGTGGDYPRNSLIIKTTTAGALTYIRRWGAGNTTSQGINSALRLTTGNILLGGYDDLHAFIVSISGTGVVTPTVIFNRRLNGSAFGNVFMLQDIMENSDGNYSMIGTQLAFLSVSFNTMIGKINSSTTNWIFGRTYAPIGLSAILPEGGLCTDQGYYVSMTDQQMAGFNFNIIRTNTIGQTSDPAAGCSGTAITPALGVESITFSTPVSLNYNLMTSSVITPVVTNMSPTRVAHCLNIPSPLNTTGASTMVTCNGACNGTASVSATGGTGPYTYTWAPSGGNAASASGLCPNTYTCSITDAASATSTQTFLITQPSAVTATQGQGSITCNGGTTTASVSASGGVGGFTYTWSPSGGNSATASALSAGNYTTTIRDGNGCIITRTFAITQPPAITLTANQTQVTCTASASATVTATGGTSTYTAYTWNPAVSTTSIATGLSAGNYTTTVTDNSGCQRTITVTITANNAPPSVTGTASGSLNCITNTTSVVATTTTSPATYTWTGPGITGGANTANATVNTGGTYNYTVTNPSNGCPATGTVQVLQNNVGPSVTASTSGSINCVVSTVQVVASTTASPVSYTWSGPGIVTGANTASATVNAGGTYNYTVLNTFNNCSTTGTVFVAQNTTIATATAGTSGTITCTNNNITLTAGLNGFTYTWTAPAGSSITGGVNSQTTTATGPGTYTVMVLNTVSGCTASATVNANINATLPSPTVVTSATITCTNTTSTLTANAGAGTFTYNWSGPGIVSSNTLSTVTSSLGGVYTVTVTNMVNGCVGTQTVSVASSTNAPTGVSASPSSFTLSCLTPSTQITATATGGATYSWTAPVTGAVLSGGTTATVSISGPGVYSVVVTGTNGCSAAAATATMIADANAPTVSLTASTLSITCVTSTPGVTVTPTGTVTIATYSWSPASGISSGSNTTTPVFTTPGTYSCLITAGNGCTTTTFVTVASNTAAPAVITPTIADITCGNANVIINPSYTPSTGLTYTWTGTGIISSANNASVTVNQTGNYMVTVTDLVNGCTNTATFNVNANTVIPTLTVSSSSTIGIGCSPTNSTTVLTANGTPTSVIYIWSTSATTSTISVNTPGVYTVTIIDPVTSCSATSQFTVDNNTTVPDVSAGTNAVMPCGGGTTTVTLNGSSTTAGVVYAWSGPNIISGSTTATPVVDAPGIYTLTVTNPTTGCVASSTVLVTNSAPTASFTPDLTSGFTPQTIVFTNASTGAITYNWIFGNGSTSTATNTSTTYNSAGTYTVMLIASNGLCSDTAYQVIVIQDGFSIEIPNVFTPNNDGTNDLFTISSTGVKEIELQIFNRWGQLMYNFTGAKAAWNGITNSGEKATDGTYFYFVIATGFDSSKESVKMNGSLSLFR